VEEVTASAQSLAELARALQTVVAEFKLSEQVSGEAQPPVPALPAARSSSDGHRQLDVGISA